MTRLRGLSHRTQDLLLMLGVLAACWIERALGAASPDRGAGFLLSTAIVVPLAFARRWPLPALAVYYAVGSASFLLLPDIEDFSSPFLAVLVGSYTAGWLPRLRDALAGLAMAWCVTFMLFVTADPRIVGDFVFPSGFALFAWTIGRAVRHRTELAAELHEAALRAAEQHEQDAARAVAEERRRIAREMHDLVGHSVSVMVVQAGGARRILERDPDRAIEAAIRIEQTGRAALAEMRRLLGLMGPVDDAFAPQPTLDGLGALVQRARDAGLPVTVSVEGEPRELPAGAELAAYRVVQEALTNAIKHAGRAPTEVGVRWDPDALEIVVADAGDGTTSPDAAGAGHGLVGMRERVRVYGGELSALPRPGGGFVVRARIPLRQDEVRAA